MKFPECTLRRLILSAVLLAVSGISCSSGSADTPLLHVSGNNLVNASGNQVILHGVDYAGPEYQCTSGRGIFAGPTDQASVTAMKEWGINVVRLPLNEACWNGARYVKPQYAGTKYRAAIRSYVDLLNSNGIAVILDMHWSAGLYTGVSHLCSSAEALCQKPMPDAAGAVPFWSSVATTFKGDSEVIFDLFNEPFPDKAIPTEEAAWTCWLNGGSACSPGIAYQTAGMQTLVNTVRAAGAGNVLMIGGLGFANDLTEWLRYEPHDPDDNLVASWHSYNFNPCDNRSCWESKVSPVTAAVPVIAGEVGSNNCSTSYIDAVASYLDSVSTGYLAWSWNAHVKCGLISNWSGIPTAEGAGYKSHLRSVAKMGASQL